MAVAELPLPPFPYEKDFFGKKSNKKKKLKKYSEHLTKHLRLRQRIVFKIKQNTKDKLSQAKWIFGLKTNRSVIKGEAYYV